MRLPHQPGGRPARPPGHAALRPAAVRLREVRQNLQDRVRPEDPPAAARRRPAVHVRRVPPGLPVAGGPPAPLPVAHQAATFPLPPLRLRGQAEVPGGQAFAQAPPGDVGGGGGGEGLRSREPDPEGGLGGDAGGGGRNG